MKGIITVTYQGDRIDTELDGHIKQGIESATSYVWYAQGYNLITNTRDLSFWLKNEKDL